MAQGDEESRGDEESQAESPPAPRQRDTRRRRVHSDGGRLYVGRCEAAGKNPEDLWLFVRERHPDLDAKIGHYIRSGVSPSKQVREALIEFLRDTPYPITHWWFDKSWEHLAPLDAFVAATHREAAFYDTYCGEFARIFPTSPRDHSGRNLAPDQKPLTCRNLVVRPGAEGILRWAQVDEAGPEKPRLEGFGLYNKSNAFLIGFNSPRHIVMYFVLRVPPLFLQNFGVRLVGLQAATPHEAPGHAIAKRNLLVPPKLWGEWEGGDSCPSDVRDWLLEDGYGLQVDLVSEKHDDAD